MTMSAKAAATPAPVIAAALTPPPTDAADHVVLSRAAPALTGVGSGPPVIEARLGVELCVAVSDADAAGDNGKLPVLPVAEPVGVRDGDDVDVPSAAAGAVDVADGVPDDDAAAVLLPVGVRESVAPALGVGVAVSLPLGVPVALGVPLGV